MVATREKVVPWNKNRYETPRPLVCKDTRYISFNRGESEKRKRKKASSFGKSGRIKNATNSLKSTFPSRAGSEPDVEKIRAEGELILSVTECGIWHILSFYTNQKISITE